MSNDSNVTDSNTTDTGKLQITDSNEDVAAPPSLLTTSIKAVSKWWNGGEDDKQNEEDNEEATPPRSNDDASLSTNTSITSSFTSTANLNNEKEKTGIPQDVETKKSHSFIVQPSSANTPEQHDVVETKSIMAVRKRQLVSNTTYPDKGKDVVEQLTTSNQLSNPLGNDAGLSLEGDVKNNSNADSNLDETTVAKSTGGKSIFSVCREKNAEIMNASNRNTPPRVSDPEEQKNRTLALLSGNNNNDDAAPSSLCDDSSVSWSGDGDTVVNNDFVAEQKAFRAEREALVAENEALLAAKKQQTKLYLSRMKEINKELADARDSKVEALLRDEFESLQDTIRSISEEKRKLLKEIDHGKDLILLSTGRIESAVFQLGRQAEKNHEEVMDEMQQGFAKVLEGMHAMNAKLDDKKSNSYNLFRKGRR